MLHIVDGTAAESVLEMAGIEGDYLEWRDVLHEGPFQDFPSFREAAELRGEFLEKHFKLKEGEATGFLKKRNSMVVERVKSGDNIVVWNSEELYDQLILLECLWMMSQIEGVNGKVAIANVPGTMGTASPLGDICRGFEKRVTCSQQHLSTAACAWEYYIKGDFSGLFDQDISVFPFMSKAMRRVLQEVPDIRSGLSRTEKQILKTLKRSELTAKDVFLLCAEMEDPPFMGDLSFFIILEELSAAPEPLILKADNQSYLRGDSEILRITGKGCDVLDGKLNMLDFRTIDRWVGGMHIHGAK